MPKFMVTIRQRVLEEKLIEVEADSREAARNEVDIENGDGFEFVEIPDRWIEDTEEMEAESEET